MAIKIDDYEVVPSMWSQLPPELKLDISMMIEGFYEAELEPEIEIGEKAGTDVLLQAAVNDLRLLASGVDPDTKDAMTPTQMRQLAHRVAAMYERATMDGQTS